MSNCFFSYLFLGNNNITELPMKTFRRFCANLRALNLAENKIGPNFPKVSLRRCLRLGNLDLSYNVITKIESDDFKVWAQDLSSLSLSSNLLKQLPANVFQGCPRLRKVMIWHLTYTNILFSFDCDKKILFMFLNFSCPYRSISLNTFLRMPFVMSVLH